MPSIVRRVLIAALLVAAFLASPAAASTPEPPATPRDYVVDLAGVMPEEVKARLNAYLGELEQKTTAQVLVLTVQSLDGQLVGAPHFEKDPCLHLRRYPTRTWNGLVFEDNGHDVAAELADLGPRAALDFSGYVLDSVKMHECDYNWKTFIEVYLEDYHVQPFHPGLGQFVTCDDLRWEFAPWASLQTVGISSLAKAGTKTYERWHKAVLDYYRGEKPRHGAIWLTYYPNIMVEWYPHVLVVSTLHPRGPQQTTNVVEFYYPEEIVAFEPEFMEAQRAAYMETCIEDDEIGERMDEGRRALLARGDNEVGPYQSPMEDGMQHFHEWYRQVMGMPAAD